MSIEVRYCYHCGTYHAANTMRQIVSKTGRRWRCLRSIDAARKGIEARTAFGRQTSATNSAKARSYALRFCNAEIFRPKF